jgi:hypothetical protein
VYFAVAAYLSLAIHIGLANYLQIPWLGATAASFFLLQAVLLVPFRRKIDFQLLLNRILFVEFPLFLLIFLNAMWPVMQLRSFLLLTAAVMLLFFIYTLRKTITQKHILALLSFSLPAFITGLARQHFGMVSTSNEWILLAEEGQIMGWVTKVLHGGILYKDAVITRGPVMVYSTALALKWFGETLLMKRAWFLVLNTIMAYCYYYFCKKTFHSRLLLWMAFIVMFLIHNYTYRTGFAVLALALFFQSLQSSSRHYPLFCGITIVAAVLSSIEAGVSCAVAIAASLLVGYFFHRDQQKKYLHAGIGVLLGCVLLVIPLLGVLWVRGELMDVVHGALVYPKYAMLGYAGSPYPNLLNAIRSDFAAGNFLFPFAFKTFFIWYLPIAFYLFGFLLVLRRIILRRMDAGTTVLFAIAVYGWLLYRSALGRTDLHHLDFSVPPAFALSLLFIDRLKENRSWRRLAANKERAIPALLIFLFPVVFLFLRSDDLLRPEWNNFIENVSASSRIPETLRPCKIERLKGIYTGERLCKEIEAVVNVVRQQIGPEDRIYAFPNMPLYYFLLDSPNPTAYEWAYQAITKKMRLDVVKDLKKNPPAFILFSTDPRQRLDRMPPKRAVPEILDYIHANYQRSVSCEKVEILIPKQ